MAIDSEDKRRSVLRVLPIADGTISGVDKQHIVELYRGIAAQVPPSVEAFNEIVLSSPLSRTISVTSDFAFEG